MIKGKLIINLSKGTFKPNIGGIELNELNIGETILKLRKERN